MPSVRTRERIRAWLLRLGVPLVVGGMCTLAAQVLTQRVVFLQDLNTAATSGRLASQARLPVHPDLLVVELRDSSLPKLGLSEIDIATEARLLRKAHSEGAKAVIFDLAYSDDLDLAPLRSAIRETAPMPFVVGVDAISTEQVAPDADNPEGARLSFEKSSLVDRPGAYRAHMIPLEDLLAADRRVVSAVTTRKDWASTTPISYIGVAAGLVGLGLSPDEAKVRGATLVVGSKTWAVGQSSEINLLRVRDETPISTMDLADALAPTTNLRGKIVIYGDVTLKGDDFWEVPGGEKLPGVQVVALFANSILVRQGGWLIDPMVLVSGWAILWASLAAAGALFGRGWRTVVPGLVSIIMTTLTPFRLAATYGVGIDVVPPSLAIVLAVGVALLAVQWHLVPDDLRLAGRSEDATVLFVDLVGSTRLTELMGGEAFQDIHRRLNAVLVAEIDRHGGVVERTLGDGVLALFGGRSEDHPHRALRCAQGVLQAVGRESWPELPEGEVVAVTLGFDSGVVSGGYVRESRGRHWSSSGTVVNRAARLQGSCGGLGIAVAIGPEAARRLGRGLVLMGELSLKGFREPVQVFSVRGDNDQPKGL